MIQENQVLVYYFTQQAHEIQFVVQVRDIAPLLGLWRCFSRRVVLFVEALDWLIVTLAAAFEADCCNPASCPWSGK